MRNKNDSILQIDLHSTMYLFQRAQGIPIAIIQYYLHSTMYLFQLP
mgnify:CR=1 FL=1